MGLLDKASDAASPAAKKPVAKAKPKAVAKAKPKAVKIADEPAAVKAKPVKAKRVKKAKVRPQGLPSDFEIASPNSRRIAWFTNFVVNLGPIFGFLFAVAILDAFTTTAAIIALTALILNLFVVPIMSGRTLGNFVSRTKNITSSGVKPNLVHGILGNSTGILSLMGIVMLMINAGSMFTESGSAQIWASIWSILGLVFIILFFVNSSFRRGSETSQGLYDSLFGAYLVKHVPAEGETSSGFIGRLEGMASYGDRFTERSEARKAKKAEKAEKVKTVSESTADDSIDAESETNSDTEEEKASSKKAKKN